MSERLERPSRERYLRTPLASFPFDLQARLVEATSVQDVYEIGVAILARIPATVCIRIFQRDDTGQMVLVHAWQSPLSDPPESAPTRSGKPSTSAGFQRTGSAATRSSSPARSFTRAIPPG
ncbi:MAG: hypothetical protein R2849_20875 [Thermomicrobiales bacterium]